jgi:type VI secretion system secreted protein VgrG
MSQFSQANRPYQATTPLGEETLLFGSMEAEERLSRLFEFVVTLYSEQGDVDADQLLGKPVTARIVRPDGTQRYFNGLAMDFAQVAYDGRLYHYRVTLRPWLWFLTLTADCRAFQNQTTPQIVQAVCRQAGFSDLRLALSASYEPREYCVQFRETDFNFVSRLLEQEGIFYYFEHSDGKHVLVLCDDPATLTSEPGYDSILYLPTTGMDALHERELLTSWTFEKSFRSGSFATRQFEFKTPTPVLAGTSSISRAHHPSQYETFDFPALAATSSAAAVEQVARVRVQELQTGQMTARGSGNASGLAAGRLFTLESHSREDLNIRYLISGTRIKMSNGSYFSGQTGGGPRFAISIEAVRADEPYRPARITVKPLVHGLQSALVVGPGGAEIYPDEYGRVKVQFHWDRQGKMDENSSCWIRVSQTWAGNGWGSVQIPRLGQEVVVSFLDGDPDRPVIVGCLYNGSNKPPYGLPANATRSGVRSRSSKGGTSANFNEILFEDKKGSEQLSLQAEKDHQLVVKRDSTSKIGNNSTMEIVGSLQVTASAITLTAGLASITLNKLGMIEISGTTVLINGVEAVNITAELGLIKGPILAPP